MFVEVIPNVFVRADCVYRIAVNGCTVAVMFNDGTGGQSQTASWSFADAEAAKKWASGVGEGVTNVMRPPHLQSQLPSFENTHSQNREQQPRKK